MRGISVRLPRYFRYLRELLMNGILKVSSNQLADRLGITPSQVKADLSRYAGAGQQGYGYNVKTLYRGISRDLGAGDGMNAVVIGGSEAEYRLFAERFEGRGVTVSTHISVGTDADMSDIEPLLIETQAEIAVICEMPHGMTTELLEKHGIKGIWNLTQTDIKANVPVLNLPLGDPLMTLCYEMKEREEDEK